MRLPCKITPQIWQNDYAVDHGYPFTVDAHEAFFQIPPSRFSYFSSQILSDHNDIDDLALRTEADFSFLSQNVDATFTARISKENFLRWLSQIGITPEVATNMTSEILKELKKMNEFRNTLESILNDNVKSQDLLSYLETNPSISINDISLTPAEISSINEYTSTSSTQKSFLRDIVLTVINDAEDVSFTTTDDLTRVLSEHFAEVDDDNIRYTLENLEIPVSEDPLVNLKSLSDYLSEETDEVVLCHLANDHLSRTYAVLADNVILHYSEDPPSISPGV